MTVWAAAAVLLLDKVHAMFWPAADEADEAAAVSPPTRTETSANAR